MSELETPRLALRRWRFEDLEPFAAMSADPEVMAYLGPVLSRAQANDLMQRMDAEIDCFGIGFWAVASKDTGVLIGAAGIRAVTFNAYFTPATEVGWRLARPHWGKGYATEAARAAMDYGFRERHLEEIVAFTTQGNTRSRNVMERLGMRPDKRPFNHPDLEENNPLSAHVVYRARKTAA